MDFPDLDEVNGSLEIVLTKCRFVASITQDFNTKTIKGIVEYESLTSANKDVGIRAFPYHQTMQMAVKSLKRGQIPEIQNSLKEWNLSHFIQKASEEVAFPELCYHCDGNMISFDPAE